jgi:hypothetical protein
MMILSRRSTTEKHTAENTPSRGNDNTDPLQNEAMHFQMRAVYIACQRGRSE